MRGWFGVVAAIVFVGALFGVVYGVPGLVKLDDDEQMRRDAAATPLGYVGERQFAGWRLFCRETDAPQADATRRPDCQVGQTVQAEDGSQQAILIAGFGRAGDAGVPVVALVLPEVAGETGGTALTVDETIRAQLDIESCANGACIARASLSEEFVAGMRAGRILAVQFGAPEGQIATVRLNLKGFDPAFAALERAQGRTPPAAPAQTGG